MVGRVISGFYNSEQIDWRKFVTLANIYWDFFTGTTTLFLPCDVKAVIQYTGRGLFV